MVGLTVTNLFLRYWDKPKTAVWVTCTSTSPNKGYVKTEAFYPGTFKFSDEGGSASDGNLIQYISNSSSEDQ